MEAGTYNNITITSTGVARFNGPIVVNGTLTVQTGGVLDTRGVLATNCLPVTGPGSFVLQTGATLRICNPDGIAASGTTGAIQLTGTRTFANDASYEYNGLEAQTTGAGLPSPGAQPDGEQRRRPDPEQRRRARGPDCWP